MVYNKAKTGKMQTNLMHIHLLQSAFSDCVDVNDIIFERESGLSHHGVYMIYKTSTYIRTQLVSN